VSAPLPRDGRDYALFAITAGMALTGILWGAGACSALLAGHPVPHGRLFGGLAALDHLGDPSAGWRNPVGPAALYWALTMVFLALAGALGWAAWRLFRREPRRGEDLLARAATLRPSLSRPGPAEVGYRLGAAQGVGCWASVEDSMLLLGPPRSGKGQNVVIPMVLDAPGAVVTTSTRPDNLTVTFEARAAGGPVAVFDPEGLAPAPELIPALRWSVVRGCEWPQTAMRRAAALVAGAAESGVENGAFWRQRTLAAVRCLLHAAALDHRPAAELYRWSHGPARAKEAVAILAGGPGAAPGWDSALDAIIGSDPRTRDAVWAMVANTFSALADPAALAAVSPGEADRFEPEAFLTERGTLYLLGTASEATGTANLVAAFVEDVVHTARRLAAASPGARLDPPLALVLDEAANYALPSLPGLMSDGGGSGITTLAVLQSLSQARDRWGREAAGAIWEAAIVKVVLGGSGSADDLTDISRLVGEHDVREVSETLGAEKGRALSVSVRQRPILAPADLRRLGVGRGLLLLRSAPPIVMTLRPWTARRDAPALDAARRRFEAAMAVAAPRAG
jgi:type IV secretion system protein VirD4